MVGAGFRSRVGECGVGLKQQGWVKVGAGLEKGGTRVGAG